MVRPLPTEQLHPPVAAPALLGRWLDAHGQLSCEVPATFEAAQLCRDTGPDSTLTKNPRKQQAARDGYGNSNHHEVACRDISLSPPIP